MGRYPLGHSETAATVRRDGQRAQRRVLHVRGRCTAVGQITPATGLEVTLAERWNGTRWTRQPTPDPAGATGGALNGVRCRSTGACVAVGDFVNGSGALGTLAEGWDGRTWTIQRTVTPPRSTGSALTGVSCPSPDACTAAGYLINGSGNDQTLAERSTVGSWGIQPTPGPAGSILAVLSRVACPSATACTATGYSASSGEQPSYPRRAVDHRGLVHPAHSGPEHVP